MAPSSTASTNVALSDAQYRMLEPVVRTHARRFSRQSGGSVSADDLAGYGWIGALEAFHRAPRALPDAELLAYATVRIMGAMRDHLRTLDPLRLADRRRARTLAHAERSAASHADERTREAAIASALGVETADLLRLRDRVALDRCARLPALDPALIDLTDPTQRADERVELHELCAALERALSRLPHRQRVILDARMHAHTTLRTVAVQLGVTESRACQIQREAVDSLRAQLAA